MPDIEAIKSNFSKLVIENKSQVETSIDSKIKALDTRIVQIRKETDVTSFQVMVNKKADVDPVNKAILEQQQRIKGLNDNFQSVAQDILKF